MTSPTIPKITRCRWSSDDDADRFSVENPATGKVITEVQGGGAELLISMARDLESPSEH